MSDLTDDAFLAEKLKRAGCGLLEDLELLTKSYLETGDPAFVQTCVDRLDGLRRIVGPGIGDDVERSIQPHGATARRSPPIQSSSLASVQGIDAYAVLIPKRMVTADFIEVVPKDGRLVVALGDAPGTGLVSAFLARFIATVFRSLVLAAGPLHLGRTLSELSSLVSGHQLFESVSLQCVEISLQDDVATVASAGHPYPVLYSTRYRRCDRLPVRGPLLHAQQSRGDERRAYELRHVEIGDGDVIVLVSDGVTEGGPLSDPYGYRFGRVVEDKAGAGARTIAEAILGDWRSHLRDEPPIDDGAILVMTLDSTWMRSPSHAD